MNIDKLMRLLFDQNAESRYAETAPEVVIFVSADLEIYHNEAEYLGVDSVDYDEKLNRININAIDLRRKL